MVRRLALAGAAALTLSACAHRPEAVAPPIPPVPFRVETITYETSACKGRCPVYRVSVSSDGAGVFTGVEHVAVIGERRFTVTPGQFAAFRDQLRSSMPESGELLYVPDTPLCPREATDLPSVDVVWTRPPQTRSHLHIYYGCIVGTNTRIGAQVGNAIDALPLGELIGEIP